MARRIYTRFKGRPNAAARHLIEKMGNHAALYARDREDTCRTML